MLTRREVAQQAALLMTTATIEELARALSDSLVQCTRDNGNHDPGLSRYTALKDEAPDWMRDVCHAAHGDMLPDDWRYEFIDDAALALADAEGDLDSARDLLNASDSYCYTVQQTGWLHSRNGRFGYVDDAIRGSYCDGSDVMQAIQAGMLIEQEETLQLLYDALEELAGDDDDSEEA